MKFKIPTLKEAELKSVQLVLPVNYEEEDIPNDFPLREGDKWSAIIDLATGKIRNWPIGKSGEFNMKVVDEGCYYLLDENDNQVLSIEQDYVPNELIPGEWGDYVHLKINEDGTVTNWPTSINIDDFIV